MYKKAYVSRTRLKELDTNSAMRQQEEGMGHWPATQQDVVAVASIWRPCQDVLQIISLLILLPLH